MKIILIDNYDSFTFNLYHYLSTYSKVDVIMHGMETIGSAERATDVYEMREQFHNISDGEYAGLLYNHFGKKRVEDELEEYLTHDFFPRFGGGIGVTRMVRALEMSGLLK